MQRCKTLENAAQKIAPTVAQSPNAKVIVIGLGKDDPPIIRNAGTLLSAAQPSPVAKPATTPPPTN
jgi:hypothetical protein